MTSRHRAPARGRRHEGRQGRETAAARPTGGFPGAAWPVMVALYGREGVRELCLELQEVFDADIPLLLFLALADREEMSADAWHLEALTRSAAVAGDDGEAVAGASHGDAESSRDRPRPPSAKRSSRWSGRGAAARRAAGTRLLPSRTRPIGCALPLGALRSSHHAAAARARIDEALAAISAHDVPGQPKRPADDIVADFDK